MGLEYDSLHGALEALRHDLDSYRTAVQRYVTLTTEQLAEAERRDAELRDDLHVLANRIEGVTRGA